MADYANPQAIVDTQWVAEHREDAGTRPVLAHRQMNLAEDPRIHQHAVVIIQGAVRQYVRLCSNICWATLKPVHMTALGASGAI